MKSIWKALVAIGLVAVLNSTSRAASTLIDSFSEGSFSLFDDGDWTNRSRINGPIVDVRHVTGPGLGDWRALLAPGSGYLDYDVQAIVPEGRGIALELRYTSGGAFNLADYNAFLLDFAGVSGSGRLKVTLDFMLDPSAAVEVPLTSAGALEVSFESMGVTSHIPFALRISIVPDSLPFSFRLNEISVIPEPGAPCLMLAAALHGLRRRRRGRASEEDARSGAGVCLRAHVFVEPQSTHTVRIIICDVNDGVYDSGVFMETGSLRTIIPTP